MFNGRKSKKLAVYRVGKISYEKGYKFQKKIFNDLVAGKPGDSLILQEFFPVYTIGRRYKEFDDFCVDKKISVVHTDRGGAITYHGPGQLVCYPVICLGNSFPRIRVYVRKLEETVIETLKDFGIFARHVDGATGVWIGNKKIASLGVRVTKGYTMHGIALNVSTDLDAFKKIRPCGYDADVMTSMNVECGKYIRVEDVGDLFVQKFSEVFRYELKSTEETVLVKS